jgi:membrane protease YdiL (CAAX protease family)
MQYKAKSYYLMTFLVTFVLWFIGAWFSRSESGKSFYMVFMLFGLITPFVLSLIYIKRSGDSAMVRDFKNRLTNLRLFNPKMWPAMLLLMPASVIISILISTFFGGSMEQFTLAEGFSFSTGFVPVLLLLLMAATFEELGWRGYAFDSLQSKLGNFKATLLFSILWSLWHLPLIFVVDSYQYEIFRQNPWFGINFFASIVPLGFIISWMCMKNRKSVLSAILFHFIVNMSQEMFAITQETKCIQSFVLLILSALIVYYDRDLFFQKNPAPTV